MGNNLARRQTIHELVDVYERACSDIRAGFVLVAGGIKLMNDQIAMGGDHRFYAGDGYNRYPDFERIDEVIGRLRRQTWSYLVEKLELSRFLSVARAKELDRLIEDGELPEITVESVEAFASSYIEALPDMLSEAVGEVFEWLRPRDRMLTELKTNSQFEVPQKVILHAVEKGYGGSSFRIIYHYEPNVTALENVFSALDGNGQITKQYKSDISNAVKDAGPDGKCETKYFQLRACKNGNLHVTFKRRDLLAKFNQIAGGRRLRGERG